MQNLLHAHQPTPPPLVCILQIGMDFIIALKEFFRRHISGILLAYCGISMRCSGPLSKPQSGTKAGPFRPVLLLWSSEGSLLAPVFVGSNKNGAHCWIRTNDPIGVNDVLYH